jgi:hypothetical protein
LGKKHGWQHILGKINMISSTFWEKNLIDSTFWEKHDWQHILGKNIFGSKFWGKT